jgi:ribosome biogenesis GTPase / thiamine phosphate phosphatase
MIDFNFDKLRRIGLTQHAVNQVVALASGAADGSQLMRVVACHRDRFTVHDGERERVALARPHLLHLLQTQDEHLTVGDWVLVDSMEHDVLWIAERIAPVTQIARRANDGRRHPLASNVDTALLTMGLDADFNLRRMERYIAMVRACEVVPVVVLTKCDIAPEARSRAAQMFRRLPATVPVLVVNGLSGQARNEIGPWLHPGQTLVLLGSSGAGKSTLINTLIGEVMQDTGPVRHGDGRGQHTTTVRSLHVGPQGACVIDTPGLRTWRPDAEADLLAATFGEISAFAGRCRFRDCRHEGEPGCEVREHVDADCLLNYQKLLRDAGRGERTPLQRVALRRKWKALNKAGAVRAREKRG